MCLDNMLLPTQLHKTLEKWYHSDYCVVENYFIIYD